MVFLVDGVHAGIFEKMLQAGELPAIRKHFVDRGLYVPAAVANTPSVTLANLTSLATGLMPGHHGVVGVNWFARNELIWRDYATIAQKNTLDGDYTAPTIFQHFPDASTYAIFFQPHRGATKFFENRMSNGPAFFFGMYEQMDRTSLWRLGEVAELARARRAWPAVTIVYLLAPDFRAYRHGLTSENYRQALRHTDRQIGRVLADFRRAGYLDELLLALTADHGMAAVEKHFPLEEFLRRKLALAVGCQRLWERSPFERRLSYYQQYTAVVNSSGDRYAAISLRKPAGADGAGWEPWPHRPSAAELRAYPTAKGAADLPAALIEQEAVHAVAYASGPDAVRLRTKAGEVEFRQPRGRGGKISYGLVDGHDPLGWAAEVPAQLLSGAAASPEEWLAATAGGDFADAPAQLPAYFRAARCGDLAVFAEAGWDFKDSNRAGHGGLLADELHVPLLLAGPGVERGRAKHVRTTDLLPTLLKLLGRAVPDGLDGRQIVGSD